MNIIKQSIYLLFFITLAACTNPFGTRTPEDPDLGTEGPPASSFQTNPDSVLAKIEEAFNLRNPQTYVECLSDTTRGNASFVFIPEQNESSRILLWTRESEERYFDNFVQTLAGGSLAFSFEISNSLPISTDEHRLNFSYTIEAEFIDKTQLYQGQSILQLIKGNNELWYISNWEDFRLETVENTNTWTTLKADFQ